jgi:hypothetical protein
MMYQVIKRFADICDNGYVYHVGDEYPHHMRSVSMARINELASDKNALGEPLILEVITEAERKKREKLKKADEE